MATMQQRVAALFRPDITLCWKGRFGTLCDAWYPDSVYDHALLRQLTEEAGLKCRTHVKMEDYDAVLAVAGKYGICIETIDYTETGENDATAAGNPVAAADK